jgi:regulator of protease activity HflC (stomatin/prohibitin superfamily)
MADIGFFKGQPTQYILKFVSGRIAREGPGLAFFYLKHNTHIVAVPTSGMDSPFVFNELTNNFQAVTLQGQFTYRIESPRRAAELLNFTIDPARRTYVSNDPDLLPQRITNVIQMETRREIQQRTLEETLRDSQAIAAVVLARVREQALLGTMGAELLNVYFLSARPTPEVAKALEAEYREALLLKADEAIYRRRGAAVDEERKIKESELNSDIALEEQRQRLIDLQGSNAQQEAEYRGRALEREAEYRARALEMELAVYRSMDPSTLLALGVKEMGENAEKIGNLTLTSEILAALINARTPGE